MKYDNQHSAHLPKADALPDCATPRAKPRQGEIAFSADRVNASKREQTGQCDAIPSHNPSHSDTVCSDCPPTDYPTNKTRCSDCPRYGERAALPLIAYLADLDEQLQALPLTSPARGPLITRIREVEMQIDAMQGL